MHLLFAIGCSEHADDWRILFDSNDKEEYADDWRTLFDSSGQA